MKGNCTFNDLTDSFSIFTATAYKAECKLGWNCLPSKQNKIAQSKIWFKMFKKLSESRD